MNRLYWPWCLRLKSFSMILFLESVLDILKKMIPATSGSIFPSEASNPHSDCSSDA